jgi:glucose dehydrogenase
MNVKQLHTVWCFRRVTGRNISDNGLTITDDYNAFTLEGDTLYVTTAGFTTNRDDFADTYYR